MSNILEQVSKTTIRLILDEPFYGHFFTGVIKQVSERIPTACVGLAETQMVKLYVNPKFWEEVLVKPEFQYGVIKHEILHVVLKHILRVKEFENKKIFNIAADIVVNQYVEPHQLIDGCVLINQFADFKMDPNQDVGYYYRILLGKWTDYLQQLGTEKSPNEMEGDENDENENEPSGGLGRLKDLMENWNPNIDEHTLWREVSDMSQAERDILEDSLNRVIENTVQRVGPRGIGNLPGGLKSYLDLLMESLKPTINWRRVLRLFTCSATRTRIKNTIRRPSKRYGTTPGLQVKNKQKLLVAVDTSGSVSNDDLREFFGEMYHIWRQGAEIQVVECDTHIHNKYYYRGTPPAFVMGRGGTAFNAPIKYANEEYFPDAIIYFTDGFAAVPSIRSRKPILWMICKNGMQEGEGVWHQLPGRVVKMGQ